MNRTTLIIGALIIVGIALGTYWTLANDEDASSTTNQMPIVTSGENPQPGSIHDLPAEPAAVETRTALATKLSVDEKSIVIMEVREATWNDGCLGLGGPAESCLQALVEGFRVELLAQGKTYVYRTDKTGATIRAEDSE